jgi:hypothetical protein
VSVYSTSATTSETGAMILLMRRRRSGWRLLTGSSWVLLTGLLALLSFLALAGSIAYQIPGALVVIAAIGMATALAALSTSVRWVQGRPERIGLLGGLMLTLATFLLILFDVVLSIAVARN